MTHGLRFYLAGGAIMEVFPLPREAVEQMVLGFRSGDLALKGITTVAGQTGANQHYAVKLDQIIALHELTLPEQAPVLPGTPYPRGRSG